MTSPEIKQAQYPHEFINEMVDVAVHRFASIPLTPENVRAFMQENHETWMWAFSCVGFRPAMRFFMQLYDQRKKRYEAPKN